MHHELKVFMKKIFKENGDRLLLEQLQSLSIKNVNEATTSQRKQLAESIKNSLPYVSLARMNIYYAELLKILNLEILDIGKDKLDLISGQKFYDEEGNEIDSEEIFFNRDKNKKYFESKEEYIQYRMEKQKKVVNHFWSKVDRSLTKFEVVFNLFWLKAGEAEIRGMQHKDVMEITNKALIGIKKDLFNAFGDVKNQFGIKNNDQKSFVPKFNFKNTPPLRKIDESIKELKKRYKGEEKIIEKIDEFWDQVDFLYNEFKDIFVISLNKEIEMKRRNLNDRELINMTEKKMIGIWSQMENAYESLKKELEIIQKEARKDYDN